MTRLRTATYTVVSVEFQCPVCGGDVHEPDNGSSFWTVAEIAPGTQAQCENGHTVKLPRIQHT